MILKIIILVLSFNLRAENSSSYLSLKNEILKSYQDGITFEKKAPKLKEAPIQKVKKDHFFHSLGPLFGRDSYFLYKINYEYHFQSSWYLSFGLLYFFGELHDHKNQLAPKESREFFNDEYYSFFGREGRTIRFHSGEVDLRLSRSLFFNEIISLEVGFGFSGKFLKGLYQENESSLKLNNLALGNESIVSWRPRGTLSLSLNFLMISRVKLLFELGAKIPFLNINYLDFHGGEYNPDLFRLKNFSKNFLYEKSYVALVGVNYLF